MNLDRKSFLRRFGAGTIGFAAAGTWRSATATSDPVAPWPPAFDGSKPEAFWRAVRDEFLLDRDFTYFNTGGLGPVPGRVLVVFDQTMRRLQRRSETGHELLQCAIGLERPYTPLLAPCRY